MLKPYQQLTDAEQKCVSAKISKLLGEGKDQEQAIAIAISECAPSKARKSAATMSKKKAYVEAQTTSADPRDGHVHGIASLDDDGNGKTSEASGSESEAHSHDIEGFRIQPMIAEDESYTSEHPGKLEPAGEVMKLKDQQFIAEKLRNGKFNIRNVPIFADHRVPGTKTLIGRKWLQAAVARVQKRHTQDGYEAPLHILHNGEDGPKPIHAGWFLPTKVGRAKFEGKMRDVVFADLMDIHANVFKEIKNGKLPYRSVEVLDVDKPEINNLSLLDTETPFFRFAPLKIKSVHKAKKFADAGPAVAYRAGFGRSKSKAYLFHFGATTMTENDIKAAEHEEDEEGDKEEKSGASKNFMMDEEVMAKMMTLLEAIADKLDIGAEEEPGPVEPEEEKEEEEEEENLSAEIPGVKGDKKYSAMQARVASLESYKRSQERKVALGKLVTGAQTKLANHYLDDEDQKQLYIAAKAGKESVSVFVSQMKKNRPEEPSNTFEATYGTEQNEEVLAYSDPDKRVLAAGASKDYKAYVAGLQGKTDITLEQFIKDQVGEVD